MSDISDEDIKEYIGLSAEQINERIELTRPDLYAKKSNNQLLAVFC